MITINNSQGNELRGIIYHKEEVVGVCTNAETFIDILCQIKNEQSDDYRMEVEVDVYDNVKRTYVYKFNKDGKMIPSSYPGVKLWIDDLNKKLLYLYNFVVTYENKT